MELDDEARGLGYRIELLVMGLSATVQSGDAEVIDAVRQWFHVADGAATTALLCIDVIPMAATEESDAIRAPLAWRRHGATALAAYGANLLTAQHDRGYGVAFVTPALVAAGERLVGEVIEPLALELARGQGRVPIRATALGDGATVIIIPDAPGLELAALIKACSDAGLTLFAERSVYVSRSDTVQIWGGRGADGRRAVELPGRPLVCIIERTSGRASRLERSAEAALRPFLQAAGADAPTAHVLAHDGGYRLLMGSEPRNAAALLAHLITEAD